MKNKHTFKTQPLILEIENVIKKGVSKILKDYVNSAVNKLEKVLDNRLNIVAKRVEEIDTLKLNILSLNTILKEKVNIDDFKDY